ncbi:MAG: outer membrane protein assembly factor BamE [Nitrosomonadales bacterium]|nr:outer membrane protein assembly factor BamE [Nitrosomonadales bacterium]
MRNRFVLLCMLAVLGGCSLSPYKMDIRQGNYVTPEMREKLKVGMTRQQVRYVLGTPMINDAFHGNRWDYVYRLERAGKLLVQQSMTLYFEGENLARVVENGQPAEAAPATADGQVKG